MTAKTDSKFTQIKAKAPSSKNLPSRDKPLLRTLERFYEKEFDEMFKNNLIEKAKAEKESESKFQAMKSMLESQRAKAEKDEKEGILCIARQKSELSEKCDEIVKLKQENDMLIEVMASFVRATLLEDEAERLSYHAICMHSNLNAGANVILSLLLERVNGSEKFKERIISKINKYPIKKF